MPVSDIDQTVAKRLYTLAEVEIASTFGRQALYKWHKAGLLQFTHVGNRTFVSAEELERLVTGQFPLPIGHRAAHWRENPQQEPRRRGRPPKPRAGQEPSATAG